jgi:hypothetical protein
LLFAQQAPRSTPREETLLRVEHNGTDPIAGGAALFNVHFCSD